MERARQVTTAANIRSAYSEVMYFTLTHGTSAPTGTTEGNVTSLSPPGDPSGYQVEVKFTAKTDTPLANYAGNYNWPFDVNKILSSVSASTSSTAPIVGNHKMVVKFKTTEDIEIWFKQ